MSTQDQDSGTPMPDPAEFASNMLEVTQKSQELLSGFLTRNAEFGEQPVHDPLDISKTWTDFWRSVSAHPVEMVQAQMNLWVQYAEIWQDAARKLAGEDVEARIVPEPGDRRFKDEGWREGVFDLIKQTYLTTANWVQETVHEVDHDLDKHSREKLEFFTRQFVDALSPSNFAVTNPQVLRTTVETNGENLVKGLDNMLKDLERGKGKLVISHTDMDAFEVGVNVATAPGKVIFQNDLIQLLQFEPTTKTVYKKPLLIIPPWINKFYILDLQPDNSFIRWTVGKGYTVFVISWINPDERHAQKGMEAYMREGILDALDGVEQASGESHVSAIGYCVGGTLLTATLAHMANKGDKRITNATFFASQSDFSDAGELSVFIDDQQIENMKKSMEAHGGYLEGKEMGSTFNMLRANDLIWSFAVNNYLLGKDPFPFDLLYWNGDTTNMPVRMHMDYLRECYQLNNLAKGKMVLGGEALAMGKIKIPVYMQSSQTDHIAPYPSIYRGAKLYGGPVRFMMAGSGHIAGVINHPDARKYQHWLNSEADGNLPETVEEWQQGATEHAGSWWPDWHQWLSKKSGRKVPARKPGDGELKPIEDAPGSYVKMKSG